MYKLFLIVPILCIFIPFIIIFYYIVKNILTDVLIISKSDTDDDNFSDEDLEILNKANNRKKEN